MQPEFNAKGQRGKDANETNCAGNTEVFGIVAALCLGVFALKNNSFYVPRAHDGCWNRAMLVIGWLFGSAGYERFWKNDDGRISEPGLGVRSNRYAVRLHTTGCNPMQSYPVKVGNSQSH